MKTYEEFLNEGIYNLPARDEEFIEKWFEKTFNKKAKSDDYWFTWANRFEKGFINAWLQMDTKSRTNFLNMLEKYK